MMMCSGCVHYVNWPPVEGQTSFANPNINGVDDIITVSMGWVVSRFPPAGYDGEVALNLPEQMSPTMQEHVAMQASDRTVVLTPEHSHLPIYHFKSVRTNGTRAEVEVLRPVLEAGPASTGEPLYQGYTLYLRGSFHDWARRSLGANGPSAHSQRRHWRLSRCLRGKVRWDLASCHA